MNDFERMDYRTSDGSMTFDFVFAQMDDDEDEDGGGWRIYIINRVKYGLLRNQSGHATHRNHFPGDTYKCICWDSKIETLEDAKRIAALWADTTAIYIKEGGRFDEIAANL